MLGSCDGVARRGVHDGDALASGGVQIDVVDTDSGPSDNLKTLARFNNVRGDLGGAADHQRIVGSDSLSQWFGLLTGVDVHLVASSGEPLDPFFGDRVSDEDACHTFSPEGA